jgi:DivIVA domain-containing protein
VSTTETTSSPGPHLPTRPLAPDDLRSATFARVAFGRRGLDEYAVAQYLDRVADEIATRDDTINRLTAETRTLKHALREWHRQMVGYDGLDLVALAQQEIEEQIAQTELYTREREKEAVRHYEQLLAEAHDRADDQLRADYREQAVNQRNLVGAVLQGLEALATQVDATLQAFTTEVDKLGLLDVPDASDDETQRFGSDPFDDDPLGPYSSDPLGPGQGPGQGQGPGPGPSAGSGSPGDAGSGDLGGGPDGLGLGGLANVAGGPDGPGRPGPGGFGGPGPERERPPLDRRFGDDDPTLPGPLPRPLPGRDTRRPGPDLGPMM